jgi:hypothetical protein|tara:strand:- start:220 stop:711 length:492 start_codon:yes stop_codon:yes gene_type:complete
MTNFYDILDTLKTYLQGNTSVNSVTFGDIFEVDLSKQTIFPLSHIMVNSCTFQDHVVQFNIQVIAMDIVNETSEDEKDLNNYFHGINNKQDVLNTQFTVINGLQSALRRGELFTDLYQIDSDYTATMFEDRFTNLLAGWSLELTITVANNQISDINANGQSAC